MARTFNRVPLTVESIDYDDTAYKYFGYSDWKGICSNKNFIGVDQETFEDASNVYVDKNGILRSRPMVVKDGLNEQHNGDGVSGYNIKNAEAINVFGNWLVYARTYPSTTGSSTIGFAVIYNETLNVLKKYTFSISKTEVLNPKIFIALFNNKVNIFYGTFPVVIDLSYDYYPIHIGNYGLYIPVTTLNSGSTSVEVEDKNVLTDETRKRYIWSRSLKTDLLFLTGKNVQCEYEQSSGYLDYQPYVEYTLDKSYVSSMDDTTIIGSSRGSLLEYKKINITINDVEYPYIELYYLVDGVVRTQIVAPEMTENNIFEIYYEKIAFSHDGNQILLPYHTESGDGIFVRSVLNDTSDGSSYLAWTDLFTLNISKDGSTTTLSDLIGTDSITATNMFDSTIYAIATYETGDTTKYSYVYWVIDGICFKIENTNSVGTNSAITSIVCSNQYCLAYTKFHTSNYALVRISIYSENTVSNILNDYCTFPNKNTYMYDCFIYQGFPYYARFNTLSKAIEVLNYKGKIEREYNIQIPVNTFKFYSPNIGVIIGQDDDGINYGVYIYNGIETSMYSSLNINDNFETSDVYCIFNKNDEIYYMHGANTTASHKIYTTELDSEVYFTETISGNVITRNISNVVAADKLYISIDNNLYISDTGTIPENTSALHTLYFPERNKITFDYDIVTIVPMSSTEVGVLLENGLYYISSTTVTRNEIEQIAYTKNKSKIQLGCLKGSNGLVSDDGQYVIYPTKRGIVAMAYQNFVSSTDQALTFLTNNIENQFVDWCIEGDIHMLQYKYWYIVYTKDTLCWICDTRNGAWWKMVLPIVPNYCFEYQHQLKIQDVNGLIYTLDTSDELYRDVNNGKIEWNIKSQKLHFNAINYYKSVNNIILSSVLDAEPNVTDPFTCNMSITTYRKIMDGTQKVETLSYYVDITRTFVKQLNYIKLGQFQYELKSADYNNRKPLSLTSIVLKYKVTGQVR